jgi:hypothetical protein
MEEGILLGRVVLLDFEVLIFAQQGSQLILCEVFIPALHFQFFGIHHSKAEAFY